MMSVERRTRLVGGRCGCRYIHILQYPDQPGVKYRTPPVLEIRLSHLGGQAQPKVHHMPHGEQIGLHFIIDRDFICAIDKLVEQLEYLEYMHIPTLRACVGKVRMLQRRSYT